MLETMTITAKSIESNLPYRLRFERAIKEVDSLEKCIRILANSGLATDHNAYEIKRALTLLKSASKSFMAKPSDA